MNILAANLYGTHLIEAGAGTGKTYTITGLYLRLLIEKGMPVGQILVVTFTKAATEELKDRIRRLLIESQKAMASGKCRNALVSDLMERIENRQEAVDRIREALREFDSAAIYTIHGFCHRLLYEHAFETGDLFDTELASDPSAMRMSIAEDFWRRRFYEAPPEFVGYAMDRKYGPAYFYSLIQRAEHATIHTGAPPALPELHSLNQFREKLAEVKSAWSVCRPEVADLLKAPSLSGVVYGSFKPDPLQPDYSQRDIKVGRMLAEMDQFANKYSIGIPLCDSFEKFTAAKIEQATLKGREVVAHSFFHLCEALRQIFQRLESEMNALLLFLRSDCLTFAAEAFFMRKKQLNIQFFDDLLQAVRHALEGKQGEKLTAQIRRKYSAALVDEFQDTDQVQFEIFYRIFAHKKSLLFMIGDPKQSIYSFRGADVFSYMQASSKAESKYTLLTNYRSDARLIQAVNTIFSHAKNPFVFEKIRFERGRPCQAGSSGRMVDAAPFKLWWLAASDERSRIPKAEAVQRIARAVAAEIGQLVGPERHFMPADIAVLVRTNQQALVIKSCLTEFRIPAVIYSAGNVFDTHEAGELERVLNGIANPGSAGLFRAALITQIVGVSADKLDPDTLDPHWWHSRLDNFISYRHTWNEQGFVRMFSQFMSREKVRSRLLSYENGERSLTNLLHLAELLHTAALENSLGISGLLKWLSIQRDQASPGLETHQLRLESDADAVKIITIHKSKGLEFPVVFCPYAWGGSKITGSEIIYHDPNADGRYRLDFGSPQFENHKILAQNELLAENLRLLYVALTRAKHRCYFVWGRINTAETSAPAYLLHGASENISSAQDDLADITARNLQGLTNAQLWQDLKKLESCSQGTIEVTALPSTGTGAVAPLQFDQPFTCSFNEFSGKIDKTWRISSYSSFISNRRPDNELPDRDEPLTPSAEALQADPPDAVGIKTSDSKDSDKQTIFSFPKGAAAGIFFHDLFEHLDFSNRDPRHAETLVADKLAAHEFASSWQKPVMQTIQEIRRVALLPDRPDFTLAGLSPDNRINEMAFLFPLRKTGPATLKRVFEAHAGAVLKKVPEQLGRLNFSPARGLMKGFIDMLFEYRQRYYLLDWKSNHLGSSINDYSREHLDEEMVRAYYTLQYHLYTLAVHLMLSLKKTDYRYERDFGGAVYIFIRGVKAKRGPGFGIYTDYPSKELVDALGTALIPGYGDGINALWTNAIKQEKT